MSTSDSRNYELINRLAEEFTRRLRDGERPTVQEYCDKHPEFAADLRDMLPALAEVEQVKDEAENPPAPEPPRLRQIDEYQIIREVGRGGMGVVYEAEDTRLGRRVALKVLAGGKAGHALERFKREARAAARLHHTNIVPVFGVGEHDGGPYYVMQFIQGLGLDEVLREVVRLQELSGSPVPPSAVRVEPPRPLVSATAVARSLVSGKFEPAAKVEAAETLTEAPAAVEVGRLVNPSGPDGRIDKPSHGSSSAISLPGQSNPSGRKPTYWQSVARIGLQVADALDYAHKQGILHRDIKPSNLLLDLHGVVWVTDFGLAKAADQHDLTNTGDLLGTLRYMPPEAFEGKFDARSDVYSLGLALYELLALRPAYTERKREQLVKQVTTTDPPRLGSLNKAIPRDLLTVIHKAIEKDPSHRYASAAEFAADLRRYVEDRPIRARTVSPAERAWRWCRRNPVVANLTAAVVVLLVAGTAAATYFAVSATRARDRAEESARQARAESDRADRKAREAEASAAEAQANLYLVRLYSVQMALDNANVAQARDLLEQLRLPGPPSKPVPGWEWRYYWRLCHNDLRTLVLPGFVQPTLHGHVNRFNTVAFSPDGTRLASVGDDGTVRQWDPAAGRLLDTLTIQKGRLSRVAYSPDGARLAVSGENGLVCVVDAAGGREVRRLTGHTKEVRGLAFSPDGARLYTAGEDGTLKTWDVAGGRDLGTVREPEPIGCVAVSPDGKWLAVGGKGAVLRVRDAADGREVRTLLGHRDDVESVAFSPDGQRLASAGSGGAVRLWDPATGRALWTATGHASEVRGIVFSPDGSRLATGSHDYLLKVWDADTGEEEATFLGHSRGLYGVAYSPDGRWLASASSDGVIKLWDPLFRRGPRVYPGHDNQVRRVAFTPDGRRLASIGLDGRVRMRDPVTGRELPFAVGPGPGLLCLAISADGRFLATGGDAGSVTVRDAATGRTVWAGSGHASWINALAFSPDGRWLASGSHDKTVQLWDAATGGEPRALPGVKEETHALVFAPDGASLIGAAEDNVVKVWDVATGAERRVLKGHARSMTDVALSRDGRRLASAGHDKTVKVWDLADGRELCTLRGHTDSVWAVAFHPDGTRLATAGWDQVVRVWDATTGLELAAFKGHTDRVLGIAFSPDGDYLASAGGADRTVRVWDARPQTPAAALDVEAGGLLDYYFSRPLPRTDVLTALRDDRVSGAAVRQRAAELADQYAEEADAKTYDAAAWRVVRHPWSNARVQEVALAQAKAACRLEPANPDYVRTLGVAQYRVGQYAEALKTLAGSEQRNANAVELAVLAMARQRLGQKDEARATLTRLRELAQAPQWAGNEEAQGFLREAVGVIEG